MKKLILAAMLLATVALSGCAVYPVGYHAYIEPAPVYVPAPYFYPPVVVGPVFYGRWGGGWRHR